MEKNEHDEKAFENLLHYAFLIAGDKLAEEIEEPEEEYVFSAEHERKMKKLFNGIKDKLRNKMILKSGKKVAVFLILAVSVSFASIFSVDAWRLEFFNFIASKQKTFTEINLEKKELDGTYYSSEEVTLGYVPEGFQLETRAIKDIRLFLTFTNEAEYFYFTEREFNTVFGIDTEDASLEKLKINGNDAYFSTKDGANVLAWHDNNKTFIIEGSLEESELIKIAENVNIKRK